MTDRIALVLGLMIAVAIAADVILNDSHAMIFLLRKLGDLIETVAVWR